MAGMGLGFTLGGVADQRIKQGALDLQAKNLKFQEDQLLHKQATENIAAWQKVVADAKSAFSGTSEEFLSKGAPLIAQAKQQIAALASATGIQIPDINAVLSGVSTKGDALEQEIAADKAKITAGVKESPGSTELTKLQEQRDAAVRAGDTKTAAELQHRIDKLGTVVGRTEQDLAVTGGVSKKRTADVRTSLQTLSGNLEELQIVADKFKETPMAGGALGQLLDTSKGIAGQIDQLFGTDLEGMVPGDRDKIVEARTQARFGVAMMLTTITGEASGRFTEQERRIAEETLRALNATSSPEQVIQAVDTAQQIMERSLRRFADELLTTSKLDLTKAENLDKAIGVLMENGLTQEQADNALIGILNRRGIKF